MPFDGPLSEPFTFPRSSTSAVYRLHPILSSTAVTQYIGAGPYVWHRRTAEPMPLGMCLRINGLLVDSLPDPESFLPAAWNPKEDVSSSIICSVI
jgi:hypothetical protein